jgi:hypothetical protein
LQKLSLEISDRTYVPEEDQAGHLVKDFALLVRVRNPFSPGHAALLVCGCHGYGTFGAAIAVTERAVAHRLVKRVPRGSDFCALLEIEFHQSAVSEVNVRELFVMPQ